MIKKFALLLIPLPFIFLLFYSGYATRIQRKVKGLIAEYKPHNEFVPTPAAGKNVNLPLEITETPKVASASPTPSLAPIPVSHNLTDIRHVYQTWNNCGPATTTMALSYFKSQLTQAEIAPLMKPDSEDKNVSPDEVVGFIQNNTDMNVLYAYNGDMETVKRLVAQNIPVMIETWFEYKPGDEMGHYELVVGYDDSSKSFKLFDSFRGPNVTTNYEEFDRNWKVFNRTFIVFYPKKENKELDKILKPYEDKEALLNKSLAMAQTEIQKNKDDKFAYFNLGTTLSWMNRHEEASAAFDKARSLQLPWRMLWYQFAIFDSYLATARYDDVINLANTNLNQSSNLEESLYYRGKAYEATGKADLAKRDFQNAVRYNKNYTKAINALKAME